MPNEKKKGNSKIKKVKGGKSENEKIILSRAYSNFYYWNNA